MDPEKDEQVAPVAPGIFTLPPYDVQPPILLGGICPKCDRQYFPKPIYCPYCLGSLKTSFIGSTGKIHAFTVVRTKPPLGLPKPYAIGYVDMEESGLRIFCLFDPWQIEHLAVGIEVNLVVDVLGNDGRGMPRLRPYFTPVKKQDD